MNDAELTFEEEPIEPKVPPEDIITAKKLLTDRCKAVNIPIEDVVVPDFEPRLKVGMKCGRNTRWIRLSLDNSIIQFLSIPFEKYTFLADLEAICSYDEGIIEAGIRPIGPNFASTSFMYRRLFGFDIFNDGNKVEPVKITISAPQDGFPDIEISPPSDVFTKLLQLHSTMKITFKLTHCHVTTHDDALALLNKVAGSTLFQLDLLSDVPLGLERERRLGKLRRINKKRNLLTDLQYPKTEFDGAPLSLYWYARSAYGMPLLRFLALYQVIEFYFPIYSQSEAQRKLKAILKSPTFRGDRDTDIAKLLSAIHVSRSGAFGDEKSQLRATIIECIDPGDLREFLESDSERKDFFVAKTKALSYHKIPLATPSADLRNDVADRVYDIRCKIVHTKTDTKDNSVELLLPFTKEAEQLSIDIELVQYLAQKVLITGSTPFNV